MGNESQVLRTNEVDERSIFGNRGSLEPVQASGTLFGTNRKKLAGENRKSGKPAIRTLVAGIAQDTDPWIHRETMKVLYHAFEKFKREHAVDLAFLSSPSAGKF